MAYKARFVNPQRHWEKYGKEFQEVLIDRLSRGELIFRQDLLDFEDSMAKRVGTKFAKGVNSGFDALHLSVKALGIGPGDEVITVAHTFNATIAAIVLPGATPVLVDIGEDWNMDMDKLEASITPKTKAIIPVHLNGRMCDMEKLLEIVKRYEEKGQKIYIIEDSAQSLGAKFKDMNSGGAGDTGCFSHYPFKIFGAFGEGGTFTTNNEELAKQVSLLRYHGNDRDRNRTPLIFGYNAILDNIQAAVLNVKLKYYDEWIKRRREIAEIYRKGLEGVGDLKLPHFGDDRYFDVYQNYVIQTAKRDELREFFDKEESVETIVSWPKPLYEYEGLKLDKTPLPMTEKICKEVISIPMYPELTDDEVQITIGSIKKFFAKGK